MTDTQRRWRRPRKDSGENPFVFVDTQHWDRSAPFTLLDSYKDDQGVTGSSGGWGGAGNNKTHVARPLRPHTLHTGCSSFVPGTLHGKPWSLKSLKTYFISPNISKIFLPHAIHMQST